LPSRRTVPWAKIFRGLAEKHGWTPDQIGKLTIYQAFVFCGMWCPEDIWREEKPGGNDS